MPDPYDVLTVAAVVDELNETISNGRIQRIGLIDARSIAAEVYAGGRRHHLALSADDREPRFLLVPEMPSLDPALRTPFGLLLRKHLRGSVILGVDQPPLERIARLSIARRTHHLTRQGVPLDAQEIEADDLAEASDLEANDVVETSVRNFTLYVELMGRHSNLILVDEDNRVIESAKRVTPAMSRVRPVLPRLPYLPPPPPDRLDPRTITTPVAEHFLSQQSPDESLSRALVRSFRGVSPQMANEISYRSTGSTETRVGELEPSSAPALALNTTALLDPLQTAAWLPCMYHQRTDDDTRTVIACSPVPMAHLAAKYNEVAADTISSALVAVESSGEDPDEVRHLQRRKRLLSAVHSAREKAERRLASLANELQRASAAEQLRQSGEAIYAYLWQIAPGQSVLSADGVTIALDPDLSPKENAQAYFERYRKAQSAAANLPEIEAEARAEIAYLEQLATLITQAPGFTDLEALAAEWNELSYSAPVAERPKRKNPPRRPPVLLDTHGNSVYVGHSGPQNDLITFDLAGPDDLWLHARGVPGSHVIIHWHTGRHDVPETIEAAAALAAWYSAARRGSSVEVDVAPRRHVRKIKSGGPGMVTYRNERTIRVQPRSEAELREVLRER